MGDREPVQCVECTRGHNGDRSCSAGWIHKRKGPGCYMGTPLVKVSASRLAKLEAVAAKLADALWEFEYAPESAPRARGYFCAGCDLDHDDRATSTHHDKDCTAAREALAAFAVLKEPTNG